MGTVCQEGLSTGGHLKMFIASFDIGVENFAYALIDKTSKEWHVRAWGTFDLGKGSPWKKACSRLLTALDSLDLQHCHSILVEQQGRRAHVNQQIATCIWAFCQCRGWVEPKSVAPRTKFEGEIYTTHRQRKLASIAWLEQQSSHIPPLLFLEWSRREKKDDMADAVMQAVCR